MRLARIAAIAILCASTSAFAGTVQIVHAFQSQGREYQVAFVEVTKPPNSAWHEDLVMRWRMHGGEQWHVVATVPGVRLERLVRIQHHGSHGVMVVSRPGGSAQFISVIEIRKHPPGLRTLLRDELDKGGFDYRFGPREMLIGFKFHYCAWHVSPDVGTETGHILTYRKLYWSPTRGTFSRGKVRIDDQAEREASLADLLLAIGADELLGVKTTNSTDGNIIAIFRPVGILRNKTPEPLRSADYVKAVIHVPSDHRQPRKVIDIKPWTG